MKRLMLILLLCAGFGAACHCAQAETLSVKVRSVRLRSEPKFWATAKSGLQYGERVTETGKSGGWYKVKTAGGQEGYLHASAVSERPIVLSKNSAAGPVDETDAVMAGKGFNDSVEREYSRRDPSLNYKDVDAMVRMNVSDGELVNFIRQGKLGKGGI